MESRSGNGAIGSLLSDEVADASNVISESQKVSTKTGNMRRSHAGSGDGLDGAVVPGAGHVDTWSKNVDERAVVGEAGKGIGDIGGTYSANGGLRGWGESGGVDGRVTGSDSKEGTRCNKGGNLRTESVKCLE